MQNELTTTENTNEINTVVTTEAAKPATKRATTKRAAKPSKPEAGAVTPAPATEAAPVITTEAAAPSDPDKRRNPDKRRTLGNLVIPSSDEATATISGNLERYRSVIAELSNRYGADPFAFSAIRTVRFAASATSCKTRVLGDAAVIARLIGAGHLATTDGETLTITGKRV